MSLFPEWTSAMLCSAKMYFQNLSGSPTFSLTYVHGGSFGPVLVLVDMLSYSICVCKWPLILIIILSSIVVHECLDISHVNLTTSM